MKSPLARDKETVAKYKIPKEAELHPRQKIAFLEEQLHQLKAMQYRSRIDVLHAERLIASENEVLKNKGHQNMANHVNEVEQSVGAIKMISQMIDEIKKENPGLQGTQLDHPEF